MTSKVVIEENLTLITTFNDEEMVRRLPLNNNNTRDDKSLRNGVDASCGNSERLSKEIQSFGSWRKLFDWACDF